MSARIRYITIDSRDPHALSRFWADALGYVSPPDAARVAAAAAEEGEVEVLIADPSGRGPGLDFIAVPEPKTVKNRVHFELSPEVGRDAAVARLAQLGATIVADHRRADGLGWVVMADPEGNEFCVERSPAERGFAPHQTADVDFPEGIRTAGEKQLLVMMLDWYRDAVVRKVEAISVDSARMSPVRSGTTIVGLVKHLALVEDSWLTDRFVGDPEPEPWASAPFDDDPDWDFHSALDDSIDDLVALYEAACARSRAIIASHELDEHATHTTRDFTLRFALVHLIEETARHLGHMDILREYLDGSTGE